MFKTQILTEHLFLQHLWGNFSILSFSWWHHCNILTLFPLCILWRNEGKCNDMLTITRSVRIRRLSLYFHTIISEHCPYDISSSLYFSKCVHRCTYSLLMQTICRRFIKVQKSWIWCFYAKGCILLKIAKTFLNCFIFPISINVSNGTLSN